MIAQIQPEDVIHSIQVHQFTGQAQACHSDYTIFCTLDGTFEIRTEDECFVLPPSGLLLLPPGTAAAFSAGQPQTARTCLILQVNPVFFLHTPEPGPLFSCCQSSTKTPGLKQMLPHLYALSRSCLASGRERQDYQILSHLYSCVQVLQSQLFSCPKEGNEDCPGSSGRFGEITSYIKKQIQEPLTLQETAAAIGLTPQYLASFFQKTAGCTFLAYLSRIKAQACLYWLACTSLSDAEIADAMGFRNVAAFRKCIQEQLRDTTDNIRGQSRLAAASFTSFPPDTIIRDPLGHIPSGDIPAQPPSPETGTLPEHEAAAPVPPTAIHSGFRHKMSDSWKQLLNIGFASQLTDASLRAQIQDIQNRIHFRYARICRLLDLTSCHQINGKKHHGFEIIFQTLDFLLSIGLTPFLELGFKMEKIHTHFTETHIPSPEKEVFSYYEMLLSTLPDFIRSCCNRYGRDTVSQWCFEVYFDAIESEEKNMDLTFGQYVGYYNQISSIIRSFVPNCRIGGTGFNTWLPLSGLKRQLDALGSLETRMDFFSIYVYGGIGHDFDTHLTTDPDLVLEKTCQAALLIRKHFQGIPVLATEFSFCYNSRSYLNDSLFQSGFIIRYLVHVLDEIQGMGYFSLSDLNVRYHDTDELFFGGNGLYNIYGIRKPAFYAYTFFNELGSFLLGKDKNYIFTSNSRSSLQGILFHYAHIDETLAYSAHGEELLTSSSLHFQPALTGRMEFEFTDVLPGTYIVKRYRITTQSGNPLIHWSKYRYLSSLSEKDLKFFRYLSHPATDLFVIEVQDGEPLRLSAAVEPQEVQLLLIDLSTSSPFHFPSGKEGRP